MHIKKLILLLFLAPVLAQAQKTTGPNYTYIAQRYEWLAGVFKALGIPAGDSAQFQTGQEMRAGALYYDSVGVDSGLYVWSGLAWNVAGTSYTDADARAAISLTTTGTSGAATYDNGTGVFNIPDYTTTASEGLTKVGSDFQLGHEVGSSGSELTTNRELGLNAKSILFNSKISPTVASIGYAHVSINVLDSLTSTAPPSTSLPGTAGRFERTIRVTGPYYAEYKNGFRQALIYEGADSVPIDTKGGDFGGGVVNELRLQPLATHTGRTVFRGGISSLIPREAPFGGLSQVVVKGQSGSRSYLRGFFTGHTSLIVMDSGQPDTLENFIHYGGRGYTPTNSKVLKSFFLRPNSLVGDSIWFLYDDANYKSYLTGSVAIGGTTGTATASSLLDVTSTTKGVVWPRMTATQRNAISSPATGLMVFDTDSTSYFQFNGSVWQNLYNTGGGGGSGTVNSGTQYRLAYYATTGDAVSEAAAITGDRALISDVNGVPTHSATTATEIGHVSGVTSAIQTQLDAKISGSLTATRVPFATAATTLSDDAAMTWDNTNKKLLIGNGTTTTGILTVNGGNQTGTGSQIVVQQAGVSGLHLGTGSLGAYVRASNNKKLLLQTNGSAGIELTSPATTGILYDATNAAGVHTFNTNAVTRAIIDNNGLNLVEQAAPSTPAAGLTSIYSTDGNVYSKDDAGTVRKMTTTLTRHGNVIDPLSTDDRFVFSTDVAITITSVKAVLVGSSTPSVTYNIVFDADRSAAGTNVYTAGQTVTSTTTMTAASGVNDATIPAGSIVRVKLSAVSGTVGELDVSITYTED